MRRRPDNGQRLRNAVHRGIPELFCLNRASLAPALAFLYFSLVRFSHGKPDNAG
jgi:hypothetical protein